MCVCAREREREREHIPVTVLSASRIISHKRLGHAGLKGTVRLMDNT